MKTPQKGFISPLLIALIALLLIGGGAYVYMHNKPESQSAIVNSATQATSTTTAIPSDWKTYVSKERNFEVKYPPNLIPGGVPLADASKNPDGTPFFSLIISGAGYNLQIVDGASPSDTRQGSIEKNIAYLNARAGRIVVSSGDAVQVGGGEAFYSLDSVPGDIIPGAWLVGQNQILLAQITAIYPAGSGNSGVSSQQGEQLFKQILSTFKFNP